MDQLIIPKLIFFSIPITFLLDIVLILWGEILSWSLMGVKVLRIECWGVIYQRLVNLTTRHNSQAKLPWAVENVFILMEG